MEPIRLLIADDHAFYREGIRSMPVSYTHLTLPTILRV